MSFTTLKRTHARSTIMAPWEKISMGADYSCVKGKCNRGVLVVNIGSVILGKAKFKAGDRVKVDIDPDAGRIRLILFPAGWTLSGNKSKRRVSVRITMTQDIEQLLPRVYRNMGKAVDILEVGKSSIDVGPGVIEFTIPQYEKPQLPAPPARKPWD